MSSRRPPLHTKGRAPLLRELIFSPTIFEWKLIRVHSFGMDVVDKESIEKGVKFVSEADGKLDILVNK